MKKYLLLLTILWVQNVATAQGWQKALTDTLNPFTAIPAYNGGYLVAGGINRTGQYGGLLKIDEKGNKVWAKNLHDSTLLFTVNESFCFTKTADSAYILSGGSNGDSAFCIKKIDQGGNTLWTKKPTLNYGRLKTYKNDCIAIGISKTLAAAVFLRLNSNGDTIVHTPLALSNFFDLDIQNDGVFILDYGNNKALKFTFDGQMIWQKNIALGNTSFWVRRGLRLHKTSDSSYYTGNNDTLLLKISKNGTIEWKKRSIYSNYALTPDNGVIGTNSFFEVSNGNKYLNIEKINKEGQSVWQKQINFIPATAYMNNIISTNDGGILMFGNALGWLGFQTFFVKIDKNGEVYPINVEGTVTKDMDRNCQQNPTDKPFYQCLVVAKNVTTGESFWASANNSGKYSLNIDTGQYVISAMPFNNRALWQSCTPSVSKTFSSINTPATTLNFALSPIVNCTAMEVQMTTPILRRCFNNTYTVNYCNRGTIKADNAYITVTLDSLLEFISTSRPISSRTGRTYRFNIGTAMPDDCGSFDITTRVRCGDSTRLGQTLCMEAKIFPDTVCSPPTLWSGANIVVSGMCQKDSVVFQVKNTGTAASSQLNSIVIEDEVLFLREPIQLPRNGVSTKKFPANGRTWRMVVEQEPNHPTSINPTAFVEGCRANTNQPFNLGFALLFPNDDRGLAIDVDCRQIVGAYDPNDKAGYPIGYKTQRYIGQNQDIEYLVRFQNTGTDTAFTVVIRDTISDKLDISSIEFGASSHAYEAEIYGKGVLKFTFNNIQLVDSFKNEPKSHGFIQYRIKQQKDLPVGTQIFNTAHIYFDFNEAVVTNTTVHTIGGKESMKAIVEKNEAATLPISVSPNPFTSTALFETPLSINADFELYDMAGKLMRKERFEGTTFEFQRKELEVGIYLFKIREHGSPLSIGKLIIQ